MDVEITIIFVPFSLIVIVIVAAISVVVVAFLFESVFGPEASGYSSTRSTGTQQVVYRSIIVILVLKAPYNI